MAEHWIDWADKIADEMMARANMQPERLEALRHEMAGALRAERARCITVLADARMGRRDSDLRSLIHEIREPGPPLCAECGQPKYMHPVSPDLQCAGYRES